MTHEQNRHRLSRRTLLAGSAAGAAALSMAHFQVRANPAGPATKGFRAAGQNAGGTLVYGLGFDLDGT
ncbi:MAG: superoxide dismutase, partial [Thermomicrobiales bacterium]